MSGLIIGFIAVLGLGGMIGASHPGHSWTLRNPGEPNYCQTFNQYYEDHRCDGWKKNHGEPR